MAGSQHDGAAPGSAGASGGEPGPTAAGRRPPVVPDPELMAQRYGRRPTRHRLPTVLAATVAGLVLLAWMVWQLAALSENTATAENLAVEVVDPTRTDVTFSVITDPGTTVSCTVRAVSPSFTEVGVREVTIGPVTERVTTQRVAINTVEEAASGEVLGCEVVDD